MNWKEIWRRKHRNGNIDYWNGIAEDYAECVEMSGFDYGIKMRNILEREGIISPELKVLDIGAGPGAVAIPLAESVKKVVAVEPAKEMVKHLLRFTSNRGITNIDDVINKKWEEINVAEIEGEFDLAICSNVLQLFRDVDNRLLRIALTSDYCCVAVNMYYEFGDIYEKLGFKRCKYPSDSTCLFNIIRSFGLQPNLEVIDVMMKRSTASIMRTWELFLGKYRKVSEKDREIIRQHVLSNSENGVYKVKGKMAVMWWEV